MSTTTHQGAVRAETMTAGQIAYEAAIADLRYAPQWSDMTEDDHRSWGRAAAAILTDACKPWENYTGEPPDDGGPLISVFVAGMVYTERLLAKLLDVTHYEGGDGSEDFDNDATQTLRNILTGAGLWDADENCPAPAPPAPRTDGGMTAGEGVKPSACIGWPTIKILAEEGSVSFESLDLVAASDLFGATLGTDADLRSLISEAADAIFAVGKTAPSEQQMDRAYTAAEKLLDYRDRATPAQPAGAVPDVLREAPAHVREVLDQLLTLTAADFAMLREFDPALVAKFEALLSAHPAGQSAGSGAEAMREAAASICDEQQELCSKNAVKCGEDGERQWSLAATCLRDAARAIRRLPAPDSTRTGQGKAETDEFDRRVQAALAAWKEAQDTATIDEHQDDTDAGAMMCALAAADALAARPAAPEAQGAWVSQAADDVLAERRRQVEAEGYSAGHDDAMEGEGQLAGAAACYAFGDRLWTGVENGHGFLRKAATVWPWGDVYWKPADRRRNLVKAGALILAEIERLDRLPAPPASSGQEG